MVSGIKSTPAPSMLWGGRRTWAQKVQGQKMCVLRECPDGIPGKTDKFTESQRNGSVHET